MAVLRIYDSSGWRLRWLLALVTLMAFFGATLLTPVTAWAHADLEETTPEDGAVLEAAPDDVTLTFNEKVDVLPDTMQLFDSDGLVGTLDASVSGKDVHITLPGDLEDGSYTVGWRVVSADTHPVTGAVSFSIGAMSGTPVASTDSSSDITAVMGAVTGIAYLGLLLAVGILWFRVFLMRDVDRRSVRIAVVATIVAAIAHLLLIPLTAIRDLGESLGALTDPAMWKVDAKSLTLRALLFVVIGLAFEIFYAPTAPTRRLAKWGVALGGLLALGSLTVVGHTTTVGPTLIMHGADFIHGASGAFWFGGLVGLSLFLASAIRDRGAGDSPTVGNTTSIVARFSTVAAFVFVGVAASGVVMAIRILGSWDALLHTTYGKVLIAKVLIVLLPLALAAWNKFRLVPAIEREPDDASAWSHLRKTVLGEAALLIVILGVTGFLVLQNPNLPSAAATDSAPASLPFAETVALGDGELYVRISPADVGDNDVIVAVMDADDELIELVDNPEVQLTLASQGLGPLKTTLEPTEDPGHYAGTINVPVDGGWTVDIVTRLTKYEEPITSFEITIPHTTDAPATPTS